MAAGRRDERQGHPGDVLGTHLEIDPGPDQPCVLVACQEGQEVGGDVLEHPVLLDGDERHEPIGLGLEHLLQDRVREHFFPGERQRPLEERLEVGSLAELGAEAGEEAGHLPTDGVAQELVAPAREQPVDRGAGDA